MKLLRMHSTKLNKRDKRLIALMHVLGDATRFKIYKIMLSGKEMCVSEIAQAVDISVPAASQHFRVFELSGMVNKKRYGQKICYELNLSEEITRDITTII